MEDNHKLYQILELSSETISRSLLAWMANSSGLSLSIVQLDNDFVIQEYKENTNITWVSESDREQAFTNEIIWSIFYEGGNIHGSSLQSLILYINNLYVGGEGTQKIPSNGTTKPSIPSTFILPKKPPLIIT